MKPREYCCCAIPLVNPGIYATLTEQFVLGVVVATLSVATPEIVGAATPSFAPWLFAIVCYIAAAIQLLGFMGVAQEKPILYRRYVTLHLIASVAAFAIAIAWVIISATRHSTAQSNCENKFFPVSGSSSTSSEGQTLCNIFSWVDVGLMGGAWVFFAITQSYFSIVVSSYGSSQRHDHAMYDSLDDSTKPFTNDIAMGDRGDPWDSRPSTDHLGGGRDARGFGHHRNESGASTVMNAPMQKESSEYMDGGYAPTTYPLSDPKGVYTQDPQPTPYGQSYYTGVGAGGAGGYGGVQEPAAIQGHPAEGSFRRKTPRY